MSRVRVKSVLSEDQDCINVVLVGHPIRLLVSTTTDSASVDGDVDSDGMSSGFAEKKVVVTGCATRLLTGESPGDDVRVDMLAPESYLVTFSPDLCEREDYSLSVFHQEKHVVGSPFFVRFVEPMTISYVHVEMRAAVIDAGRLANLVVPLKERGELDIGVEGPFGSCETTAIRHSFDEESLSMHFVPKGAGAYTISVKADQNDIGNSPFLLLADFSTEEALDCCVFPEDRPLFERPVRFQESGGEVSFRISTLNALPRSHGPGDLTVMCSGPGKAAVGLAQSQEEERGMEVCTVRPSCAGDYRISVLWKGQHITGSPYTLRFRRPRTRISSSDLDLHLQKYHLQVPYRFRLNCSELGGRGPEVSCDPPEAARIEVAEIEGSKGTYKCEVLPQREGTHHISVRIGGKDIEGSPFPVMFEDPCRPSACKILESTSNYEIGGCLTMKVSTQGAGPGKLEATAEDPETKISISLDTKELSEGLYQLDFDPGQMSVCKLSVMYGGRHIPGSPYRMVFSDPNRFSLKGEGLLGGVVGHWNAFTLRVSDRPQGELNVAVRGEEDQVKVETSLRSSISRHLLGNT